MPTLQAAEPVSEMWVNVWFLPERTYLTTEAAPKPLSRHNLDLIVQ